jgi:hypothetical protein
MCGKSRATITASTHTPKAATITPASPSMGISLTSFAGGRKARLCLAALLWLREPAYSPKGADASSKWVIFVSSAVKRTSENSVKAKFSLPHQPAPERYLMYAEL